MAVKTKEKWKDELKKRKKRKHLSPAQLATLGRHEPILVWFGSWRDIPAGVDHPFRI